MHAPTAPLALAPVDLDAAVAQLAEFGFTTVAMLRTDRLDSEHRWLVQTARDFEPGDFDTPSTVVGDTTMQLAAYGPTPALAVANLLLVAAGERAPSCGGIDRRTERAAA